MLPIILSFNLSHRHLQTQQVTSLPWVVQTRSRACIRFQEDAFELSYTHLWDEELDVEHGLWNFSYTYQINKNFFLQALYRKGRDLSTTEKIDEVNFGIGFNINN